MTTVLRYPGGKTRAVKTLINYIPNNVNTIISPFFGGGSFELALASQRNCRIIANDKFEPLYNFWVTLKHIRDELVIEVRKLMPLTKDMFYECRKNISDTTINSTKRAAYYFALNRSSFSGSTLSGGFSAESAIARFTDSSVERLLKVQLENVEFYNMDCNDFLTRFAMDVSPNRFIYLDPPYLLEVNNKLYGSSGDMHEKFQHNDLYTRLVSIPHKNWIMSYNNSSKIQEMYKNYDCIEAMWAYGMNKTKKSSELIITPVVHVVPLELLELLEPVEPVEVFQQLEQLELAESAEPLEL